MHTTLSDCIKDIEAERTRLDALVKQSESSIKSQRNYIDELERQKALLLLSLDMEKINLGEHVLSISMYTPLYGDDATCIDEAILELANNAGEKLFTTRNSTKDYDGWSHQRCGWMPYGCGPRHGHVVFSIGISRPLRDSPRQLTNDEIEAAIYLLEMLKCDKWKPLEYFQSKRDK